MNSIPAGYKINTEYSQTINVAQGDEIQIEFPAEGPSPKGAILCFSDPVNANSRIAIFNRGVVVPLAILKAYESFMISNNQQLEDLSVRGLTDLALENTVSVTYLINAAS